MKVLSIGNSFSQDAHKWLHDIAELHNVKIELANLYIGGCSLETHWKNFEEDNEDYDLEINGNEGTAKISISKALTMDKWDIITLQQVSGFSGFIESYEPYLSNLAAKVKIAQPDAKIYFHQTWAYEIDSQHSDFSRYNREQKTMYSKILEASKSAADSLNAPIIPVGRVIQFLRENVDVFDYSNGGLSLCRDGFHLSYDYGRFVAAATWFITLTGQSLKIELFNDFDVELLKKIIVNINSFLNN